MEGKTQDPKTLTLMNICSHLFLLSPSVLSTYISTGQGPFLHHLVCYIHSLPQDHTIFCNSTSLFFTSTAAAVLYLLILTASVSSTPISSVNGGPRGDLTPSNNQPTVEFKVDTVGIHEKRLRKCLSKLRGIEKVEVDPSNQKVTVTVYVHRNKVLKAIRRAGLKADFWSAQNELLNAYTCASYGNLRFSSFNFF